MFKATSRNIHTYPHKSYLPIFDRSTLECSSLLRMRKNKCLYYAEKSIMQEVKKNKKKKQKTLKCISCFQALHTRFKFSESANYLPLN